MKQFALSLALLSSVSYIAASTVEVDLTVNGKSTSKTFEFDFATQQAYDVVDEFEGYFFKAHVVAQEDGLTIDNEISTRNAAGEIEVVSQPVLRVDWEKEGVITLAGSDDQSLTLIVHAHK
jgi:hypothetical protein